ncbi:MAG: hypothetical protein IKY70_04020 [Bacteroidales bacterium]|nr:hypothetical protein [Bacteroidales bacterium]
MNENRVQQKVKITFEEFASILQRVENQFRWDLQFSEFMQNAFPDSTPPIYNNGWLWDAVISSLEHLMQDNEGVIKWWVNESQFGSRTQNFIGKDNRIHVIDRINFLYNYLTRNDVNEY